MDFEPIPYFYDSIDRNAIIVRPKELFISPQKYTSISIQKYTILI